MKCSRDLVHPDDAPAGHREALPLHVALGLDRIDVLVDLVHLQAHAERGERRRFHEPDVPDGAVVHATVELLFVQTSADLALQLQPSGPCVDHPPGLDAVDPPHHVAQGGR